MPAEKKGTDDIMVAVGAVVLDETNRVLLVKHVEAKRGGFWFGKWICPGGKLQRGESLEEGTKREVKEETSLEIELTGKPVVFDRIVKRAGKAELHVVYIDHTLMLQLPDGFRKKRYDRNGMSCMRTRNGFF